MSVASETPCPPDHGHGIDTVCYGHHGCRCTDCREGVTARMQVRRREVAYGTYTRAQVPAGPVRQYLEYLARCGMGIKAVARVTGLPVSTISAIRFGRQAKDGSWVPAKRVGQRTAHRILDIEVRLDVIADGALVDARGTIRRLQALQAIGWTTRMLAARMGIAESNFSRTMHEVRVTAAKARQVVHLYDELWDARPPASTPRERESIARVIARAAARGWVPPMAWDDIDLDDAPPTADLELCDDTDAEAPEVDHGINVAIAVSGGRIELDRDERLEALKILHRRGYLDGELADLLCVCTRTIERDRKHLGLVANYFAEERAA